MTDDTWATRAIDQLRAAGYRAGAARSEVFLNFSSLPQSCWLGDWAMRSNEPASLGGTGLIYLKAGIGVGWLA